MHVLLILLVLLMLVALPWRGWHEYGLGPSIGLGVLVFLVLLDMILEVFFP